MAESMIERVARAIIPDAWHETVRADGSKYFTLVCWSEEQAKARRYARAAIEAMREPTFPMQEAGEQAMPNLIVGTEAPVVGWRAMIDAALKPDAK